MASERRHAVRHVACFPTFVEKSDTSKAAAMIADFAEGGMRLLVRHPEWEVGDELNLELHLSLKLDMTDPRLVKGACCESRSFPMTAPRSGHTRSQCNSKGPSP